MEGSMSYDEEVRNKIIEYLQQHGKATWKELLDLGIPKTTLYRTLKKLENSGIIKKDSRGLYVLVDKAYITLIPTYAKQICTLIECDDVDKLTADLMKVGKIIEDIERVRIDFIERYSEIVKSLDVAGLLESFFKGLYSNRGFFTILLYEMSKVMKGIDTILNCSKCEAFTICPKFEDIIKAIDPSKALNIPKEVLEKTLEIGIILKQHNYQGVLSIPLLGSSTKVNIKHILLLSISNLPLRIEILKLYSYAFQLTSSYYETGCRPLGEKEIEELKTLCNIIS